MNTAVINVKVEPRVKREAKAVAEKIGISLSSIIHAYLKQFIATKSISFSIHDDTSRYFLETLAALKDDIKKGNVKSLKSPTKVIKNLDILIKKYKAK